MITERDEQQLLERMKQEAGEHPDFKLPVVMDLGHLMGVVACLQLALRHPANSGSTGQMVRSVVKQIIDRLEGEGFPATAEALRLGDNPENDVCI